MEKTRILVVDDAPENLDLLVGLLKDRFDVQAAINGEIALKIAQSEPPPDLILLDIVMPGIDGIEVCKILKENATSSDIPIVFLSSEANTEDTERGMEFGGTAYLQKPVDVESLFSVIEIALLNREK